jgi:hypothetical protein
MVFRDRHHRITRTRSVVSQATFSESAEPKFSAPLSYDHGWRDIINTVTFSVEERGRDAQLSAVWTGDRSYSLSDGQTIQVTAQAADPFLSAVTPVAGIDYQLRVGFVHVSLSRTSGQSTTISIRATGGPAVIDSLQLRAYSVPILRTTVVEAVDSTSAQQYGTRTYPYEVPWAGVNDAQAIADMILAQRAQRLPIVSIRIVCGETTPDARLVAALARDLSDRVTIVEPQTGLAADFWVEQIQHSIDRGKVHEIVLGCEKIPTQPTNVFTFDVAGRGFNDGRFGVRGLDDGTLIFRFDDPVTGKFGTGVFGT